MSKPIASNKILFILRTSTYGNTPVSEAIDVILAAATLDQIVSIIFLDDGVWQLKGQQKPQVLQLKSYPQNFKLLAHYDNINLWVEEESLNERKLTLEDLFLKVNLMTRDTARDLITSQNLVFTF